MTRKISADLLQTLDKSRVGLNNVDNTADINKPVSTAIQTALNLKASLESPPFTGTVTVNGVQIETRAQRGVANGYAALGSDGKVPSVNLPDNGSYKGNWNASTNTPIIVAGTGTNGDTYTVSVAGTQSITGSSTAFTVGDQLRYTTNGNKWERIPNTQLVSSVVGLVGTISNTDLKSALTLTKADVSLANVDNTSDLNKPVSTATSAAITASAATKQPLNTRLTSLATGEAEGRAILALPFNVPNGYSGASLKTALAANKDVCFAKGTSVTIGSFSELLSHIAGGTLNLNGGTITYNYSDSTNNTNMGVGNISSGTIALATGMNIHRLVGISQNNIKVEDLTISSVDEIVNFNDNDDAALRIIGTGNTLRNVRISNFGVALRVYGANTTIDNLQIGGHTKALLLDGCVGFRGNNLKFIGAGANATTDPGHGSIGGGSCHDCVIVGLTSGYPGVKGSGEHSIYLSNVYGAETIGFRISHAWIYSPGQCGLKLRNFKEVVLNDVHTRDMSFGNSPGSNEDGFRLERCTNVLMTNCSSGTISSSSGGYNGLILLGAQSVIVRDHVISDSWTDGLMIGQANDGVHGPPTSSGDVYFQGVIRNVGGAGIAFAHNDLEITGDIIIDVDIDGAAGAPVDISGITAIAAGKKVVIRGTYKNCGAPPPLSTAQIDLTGLLPAGRTTSWGILRPETQRLLNGFTSAPKRAVTFAIDDAIDKLISSGAWTSLIALWWLADPYQENSLQSWKNPGVATLSLSSTPPIFTSGSGWSGNGVGVLDSNVTWSTFPLDNVSYGLWATTNQQDANASFGTSSSAGTSNRSRLLVRNTSDQLIARLSATSDTTVANTDGRGHYTVNRISSTTQSIYKNGTLVIDSPVTSTNVPTGNVRILGNSSGTPSSTRIGLTYVGTGLDAPKIAAIDAALRPLMTLVGAI